MSKFRKLSKNLVSQFGKHTMKIDPYFLCFSQSLTKTLMGSARPVGTNNVIIDSGSERVNQQME